MTHTSNPVEVFLDLLFRSTRIFISTIRGAKISTGKRKYIRIALFHPNSKKFIMMERSFDVLESKATSNAVGKEVKKATGTDDYDDDDSSSSSSSCDELIFGIDFSKLDVSAIVEEEDEHNDGSIDGRYALQMLNDVVPTFDFTTRIDKLLQISKCDDFVLRLRSPLAEDMDHERLFATASKLGAQLDGIQCQKDSYGGRFLVATRDSIESSSAAMTSNDVIAVLPRSLRIGQHMACQRLGLPTSTPDLSALSLFLLDLMFQVYCNDTKNEHSDCDIGDAFYYLYAKCLPRQSINAINMSKDDVQYWSNFGQEYETALRSAQSQGESCSQYIHDCLSSTSTLSADKDDNALDGSSSLSQSPPLPDNALNTRDSALYWAISMVQSRTHGFATKRSRWLTPIFDFCNHSRTPNCVLEGDAYGRLVLKSTRSIKAGEEITIDYMVDDDAKLVATYGFSMLHHPPPSKNATVTGASSIV